MSNWAAKNNNNKYRLLVLTAICLFAWGGANANSKNENIEDANANRKMFTSMSRYGQRTELGENRVKNKFQV